MISKREKSKKFVIKLKAGVVIIHRGQVLLIRERNNRTGWYGWNIVKGTFEPDKDASIMETAKREAREEAGVIIKLRHLLGMYYLLDGQTALMMITFTANLLDSQVGVAPTKIQTTYRKSEDIIETKFFTKQELLKMVPADFVGLRGYLAIQDYLKGKYFPLEMLKTLAPK